jgi:hypothetical protein
VRFRARNSGDVMEEAKRRLHEAQARLHDLSSALASAHGHGDWDQLRAAQEKVLVAEREVADAAGDEYAVEMTLGLVWDIGAPLPHLLANGHKTYVLFYLADPDPAWDGTWVNVVDPAASQAVPLGVVEFHHVHSIKLGGPNDEALDGHPLTGKGLRAYAAHKVVNSRWIAAEEQINSVHPNHRGGWHDQLNHYVFCFHDETLECLAESFTTERHVGSPQTVLARLLGRLWDGQDLGG